MSAALVFGNGGLEAFAREVAGLPALVRAEIKPLVVAKANALHGAIDGEYAARGVSSVGNGMHVDVDSETSSLGASVVNPSPTAHLYEQGTATRYDAKGRHRGRMPAGNVMFPRAERARRELLVEIQAALERLGRR